MKRAKDKYMINRIKYKDIKRYDHQQMEDFLTDVYKNGYADGKESVPGVELQDVEKALQDVKGIGPVVWNTESRSAWLSFSGRSSHERANNRRIETDARTASVVPGGRSIRNRDVR